MQDFVHQQYYVNPNAAQDEEASDLTSRLPKELSEWLLGLGF